MKNKIIIKGIIISICCIFMIGLFFFIDEIIRKNYDTDTPSSSGQYDMFIKYDYDFGKYANDTK